MRTQFTCAHCGLPASSTNPSPIFCSIACRGAAKRRPAAERFWSKVDRSGDCWLWTASDTGVYGQFHPTNGRRVYAHRFAYELTYGPIPAGLFICHHCDVPLCVRPAHLYAGTRADNVRDMLTRGRNAKGERHISRTHPERMRRGETHHRTTVTTEQVREMRRLAADGVPTPVIAERFGVARETAGKIIRRQRWQHVE